MKKNYLRMICVTLAILVLSIGIAMLSVTALDEEGIAVTSEEYVDILTPLSSEGGSIEDEIPSMGEITMGDIIGPSSPVAPDAITTEEIPDGVYALRNVGNTNRWMDMEQNHVEPGKHIQQYAYSSSPATAFSRAGLFKISKKPGTTNYYIIRSMLNNRLSFEIKNNQVITKEIPANDNDVSLLDTFTITYNTNGYVIQPGGRSDAVCAPNTTASGGSGSYLIKSTVSEAGNRAKWILEPYTGANQWGASFSSPSGLSMGLVEGKAYSVKGYSWTTLINVNKLLLEVPYSYVDTASSVWYDNTEIMRLTLHKAGKFQIYIYIYNEDEYDPTDPNDTPARTFYGNYMSVPPIEDGMNYFIQNEGTKRYMDVEGPSTAEGAIIQQWSFSTATQKKWIFTRESGGYFTIKSAYSNKYVGVDSTNTSVIRQYATQSDYTKWYFVGTDSDKYSIHCKASAVTGVLALPSVSSGDGANLRIYAYTDDTNYRDEWRFEPYSIVFCGITSSKHDHISCLNEVADSCLSNGVGSVLVRDGAVLSQTFEDDLLSSNIFTSRSHGAIVVYEGTDIVLSTYVLLNEESESESVTIQFFSHVTSAMDSEDSALQPSDDYSNIDIVLFIGCSTGYGGEGGRNLPSAIVEYGAKVAIGFPGNIDCDAANEWTEKFYLELLSGESVNEAVNNISSSFSEKSGLKVPVICGNKNFVLR